VRALLSLFKPAPHIDEIENPEQVKTDYQYWRLRIFYSMFIGYAFYYFTRKSFTFAMPSLMLDLGLDKSELGFLGSVLAITYGLSKFASGLVGDRSNPRYFMSVGLILTGVCNICFGASSSLVLFALFWGLNGWFQGFGWPGCARLLTHWYSQSERGRWWSSWNASHNIGGIIIPIIVGVCAQYYGWRAAMYVPGVLCIMGGLFLMNRLRDTPQSLGLPQVEKFRQDYPTKSAQKEHEEELSVREILFKHVLKNPFVWLLAFSYFFVYIIRQAVNDWTVLYLVEAKSYSQMGAAAVVAWFEVGGIFGSLAAGWASDKMFNARRGPVNALFCVCTCLVVGGFWCLPQVSMFVDSCVLFLIGFFIFGPQMLIGMQAAELAHKKAAASATGFVGWVAYAGAAVAGYPLGKITQEFGWEGFFVSLAICSVVATLLLLPLWNIKTREDTVFKKPDAKQKDAETITITTRS